jgi:tetratricopeptide (TPR) repeat protein
MFGRRNRGVPAREAEELLQRARKASRMGDPAAAARAQESAAALLRPGGPAELLGSTLYALGRSLTLAGRPDDAVDALDEAEQTYLGLPRRPRVADWVADVQARRATAFGLSGSGASAMVDAQSAVVHYRVRGSDDPDDPAQLDLARVLAINADVLAAYGDPDLAVGSADQAVRLALRQLPDWQGTSESGVHVGHLRQALSVAIAVHAAHGRADLAGQAQRVGQRVGLDRHPPRTVLAGRAHAARPPALAVTVAGALAAAQRLGRPEPRVGDRPVVRPALDPSLVVPLDRVLMSIGAGATSADAAARLGRSLAGLATELLSGDPAAGVRLGLEAHVLLAGASRLESTALRQQLPAYGPGWAHVLLACSRRAEADRDLPLALDLAAWAGGVAEQMFPATLVDQEAREVAIAVLDHHGRLLAQRGETARARDAGAAAARLRSMS